MIGIKELVWRIKARRMERRWGECGLSPRTVNAYIRKNDSVETNVPLQIVRNLVDELIAEMATSTDGDALALAEKNGMLKGYYKTALRLREIVEDGRAVKKAGGLVVGGEDE